MSGETAEDTTRRACSPAVLDTAVRERAHHTLRPTCAADDLLTDAELDALCETILLSLADPVRGKPEA